ETELKTNKSNNNANGKTTFAGNESTEGDGGAICAWYSDLIFSKDVEFKNNSSSVAGGAISMNNDSSQGNVVYATFNGLATFGKNSSAKGGAIDLWGNINMTFNSGLRLIGNTTGKEKSGAVNIKGVNNSRRAIVTIVQKNSEKPIEFRGNKSGTNGRNAFYLEEYAELNFIVENGNIDLYDAIAGDENWKSNIATLIKGEGWFKVKKNGSIYNIVTINEGAGWFNVKEGGSIDNVDLRNGGNLNLVSAEPSELKLKNFTNSGKIKFGIYENGENDKITAYSITLGKGTILEVAATRGNYEKGQAYDILVSKSAIVGTKNINLMLQSDSDIPGIRGKFANNNKVYRIFIEKDGDKETEPDDFSEETEEETEEENNKDINTENITENSETTECESEASETTERESEAIDEVISHGGAIFTLGDDENNNTLEFNDIITFSNESTEGNGGVVYAYHSNLNFNKEVNFKKNKSKKDGGAVYSLGDGKGNAITFNDIATFTDNESTDGDGGAIYAQDSDATFSKEVKFKNNTSRNNGGAIYSRGDNKNNALTFNDIATFTDNESTEGSGGAMYAERSDMTFNREVKFEKNKSKYGGGAILAQGDAKSSNTITFNDIATFTDNTSTYGDGGAVYARALNLIFCSEVKFENNTSWNSGGAAYFVGDDKSSILAFNNIVTFTGNESTKGSGGAIYTERSDLTFSREVKFEKNKSSNNGGAIYFDGDDRKKNSLTFNNIATFIDNESTDGDGGAIYVLRSDLIFGEEVKFENNTSWNSGGAIYSDGYGDSNTLTFSRKTTFVGNKSTDSEGGAIYAEDSNLTFDREVKFENNSSNYDGGAIYSKGNALKKNSLTFNGRTIFTDNKSTDSEGGAIYAKYSDLIFSEEVKFENNSSFGGGGAISLNNQLENAVDATFNRLATFEKNSSARGGAIYLWGNVNIRFNSGLKLIGNTTGEEKSGAVHVKGIDSDRRAIVTIVQKNSENPMEFSGNTSNNGSGRNAFYLEKCAELNFTVEKGNIDLYDVIAGDKNRNSNIVTINEGPGWFNVREKGSIDNVNLRNGGSLNLASAEASKLKLKNFTNSGKIKFGIYENGENDRITAENITLDEGTILEVVAARETYEKGQTYDILVSTNAIVGTENINLVPLGDSNILDIQGKFINDNKVYRIVVGKDAIVETDPVDFTEEMEEAEERNMNSIDNSRTVYRLSGEVGAEERNIPSDAKILAGFISDVITLTLLDSSFRPVIHSREGIYLESSYRNI
ncbi:MAG: hypothetical protein LBP39_00735, partial [Rickettsiales bacterium]|nr:hypothetical protein [Rickettsiales bacterium]